VGGFRDMVGFTCSPAYPAPTTAASTSATSTSATYTEIGEHNASLTPAGATLVEGFTGGGVGPQALPQKAPLETIIDALNERLGGILTDADKLWVQQSFEFAAKDQNIATAAKVNSEENFGYVFDGQFQDLVITRHDQNAELIARVFADTETTDFFTRLARKAVWELAREQATRASDSGRAS
jgi:type I restriction enzyme, R subunit